MAAVPSIVYGLWGFFLIMPHAAELALWLQKHFGWIPIFDVKDTDPNAAVWDTSRYVASAFCAGIAVVDDGDADGLRGDAPGLLADPARREGGRARARRHQVGDDHARSCCPSAAAASSAARCSASAGRSARPSPWS